MEEAYEILNYLPIRFKNVNEQEYIQFLWASFESNYQNEKYQFAFMAYHMLFMSFVYFNVWQIKQIHEEDYNKITLGFNLCFEDATSPFTFSQEQERKIFTLFRFLGLEKEKIGQYKKIVDLRNEIAHSNGNIFFRFQDTIDEKINDILRFTKEIQDFSKRAIQYCYKKFLLESQNEDDRQYYEITEQIKEVLIHAHYLSLEDLKFCFEFDITQLKTEQKFAEIKRFHEELLKEYSEELEE